MLAGLQGEEMPPEKYNRMLAKINKEEPLAWEKADEEPSAEWESESKEASELAAMYRSEGDEELSPELMKKLADLEKQAAQPPDEEENSDAD